MGFNRSEMMSRIRGKNTDPERRLRSALWAAGLRYRIHARTPVGRPDVVFPGSRTAVFIDGCFWHGCPEHYVRPRTRTEFWSAKLLENVDRDTRQTVQLEQAGWRVCRFWEHQIYEELASVVEEVEIAVRTGRTNLRPEWRVWKVTPVDKAGERERRHLRRLRIPEMKSVVEQRRHTRKWKRPAPAKK